MGTLDERLQLLRNHAARAGDLTPQDLWRLVTVDERKRGFEQQMRGDEGPRVKPALKAFLKKRNTGFRPQTVEGWDASTVATHASRLAAPPPDLVLDCLVGYFVAGDRAMQTTFLEAAGIQHQDGHLDALPPFPAEAVDRGAAGLLAAFPQSTDALLYLIGLSVLFKQNWTGIDEVLARVCVDPGHVPQRDSSEGEDIPVAALASGPVAVDADAGQRPAFARAQTTLDRLLVQEAIRASAAAIGASPLAVVAGTVEEFVRIQPLRVPSYFHLGFVDALMGERPRTELPAENEERWSWYDAGWISGRYRLKDWAGIVEHFDASHRVHSLGSGGGASDVAIGPLVGALAQCERHEQAAKLIAPEAFAYEHSELPDQVLGLATGLLRQDRAVEARAYLNKLEKGVALRLDLELDVPEGLVPDMKRRIAHCLRHEGLYQESKVRLQELLAASGGLEHGYEAMVAADIGLLEAETARLSDLSIPIAPSEAMERLRTLEKGLPWFERAAGLACAESAHGRYPLGLRALTQGEWDIAFRHLESAVALFAGDPERYASGALITKSRFFAAIAGLGSDAAPAARAPQFLQWITAGLSIGLVIPESLLETAVVGAYAKDHQVAAELVKLLIQHGESHYITAISALDQTGAEAVLARALLARFIERRPTNLKDLQLCERVLHLARAAEDAEAGRAAIDLLYGLALERVGRERVLTLLEDVDTTGWLLPREERDELRLSLLEALGDYPAAAALCDEMGHRLLASHEFAREVQAADLLERALAYPAGTSVACSSLRARLDSIRQPDCQQGGSLSKATQHVCVAVVGGNETQQQYQSFLHEWARSENISLEFIASGWTSNWNTYLADFERLMAAGKLDGVVILRFVRTEFGRAVRKRCEKLAQLGIGGHGRESIRRAIAAVAEMAREQQLRRQGGGVA